MERSLRKERGREGKRQVDREANAACSLKEKEKEDGGVRMPS